MLPPALANWLATNGFTTPSTPELIEAAVAGGIAIAALATGWLAGGDLDRASRHSGRHASATMSRGWHTG